MPAVLNFYKKIKNILYRSHPQTYLSIELDIHTIKLTLNIFSVLKVLLYFNYGCYSVVLFGVVISSPTVLYYRRNCKIFIGQVRKRDIFLPQKPWDNDVDPKPPPLMLCMLGNFTWFLSSAIFFQNQLSRKILSGIPSAYQTVWILIMPDLCRAWFGSKLFANVISERHQ